MRITTDAVIGMFIVIFIVIYLTMGVDNSIPLFLRIEFDNSCNKYLAEMSVNGGLDQSDKEKLKDELEKKGFTNISIDAEDELEWGDEGTLKVKAEYKGKSLDQDLKRKEDIKVFNYETSTGIYGLEN